MLATRNAHLGLGNYTLLMDAIHRRSSVPHRRLGRVPLTVSFLGISRPQHQESPEDALVLGLWSPPLLVEETQRPHRLDPNLIINEPFLIPPK